MLSAFNIYNFKEELMAAARAGDRDTFDRLCLGRNSPVDARMLVATLVEAAANKQVLLMRHIWFRLMAFTPDCRVKLNHLDWNTAVFESFKAGHFDFFAEKLQEDLEWNKEFVVFAAGKMVKENWDFEKMRNFFTEFCTHSTPEQNPCWVNDFQDCCSNNGEVGSMIRRAAKEAYDDKHVVQNLNMH